MRSALPGGQQGTVGVLGVERQRDAHPGGGRGVTHASSPSRRGSTRRARDRAGRSGARPGVGPAGWRPPAAMAWSSAPTATCRISSGAPIPLGSSVTSRTAAPSSASSRARPRSRSRVSGSVAMTMAASPGPASSSGPWRNWAVCSDSTGDAHRLLDRERAHLGGGARRATAQDHRGRAGPEPGHQVVGQRRGRPAAAPSPAPRARIRAAARRRPPRRGCRRRPGPRRPRRRAIAANVIVEGPVSSPARVSMPGPASAHSEFAVPFVTATSAGGSASARACSATRTTSALSPDWLTATTRVSGPSMSMRKCSSSAASSISATAVPARASSTTAG